jgi:hypothetical protein
MIQHTVAFRLVGDCEQVAFLARARELGELPGVRDFEVLAQVGAKNEYTHALSMHFDSQADYDHYNEHPAHLAFVNDVWIPGVADFIELDYVDVGDVG